ncbi:MAG: amino acid adenylation domain-containing protein, partial [Proteobacteria bacterium]|nr:amino acid adenylation domain-containing protein [Pseudomonadota bacterium]
MNIVAQQPRLTLLDLMLDRVGGLSPDIDKPAFTFLGDGQTGPQTLTFADLHQRASHLAARIQARTKPGDRVLLIYPPGLDYIIAFYGCVYAGVIAVPALPPSNPKTLPRLALIIRDATPALALAPATICDRFAQSDALDAGITGMEWLASDRPETGGEWRHPGVAGSDILFLQYTSGSTGAPKGVMVRNENALGNLAISRAAFRVTPEDVIVSWLPPHHDFGLIGAILAPVHAGCHAVHMSPAYFMMRPHRWLRALSDYRGTFTGGPNFSYELCNRKILPEQMEGVDLSSVRLAVNGAERIRAETVERFAETFAPYGFRRGAMTPAYGLAESTLFVSTLISPMSENPRMVEAAAEALAEGRFASPAADAGAQDSTIRLVSNGPIIHPGHVTAIVDPETGKARAEGEVGEIWLSGPSIAGGYWNRPEETRAAFGHRVPGIEGRFLRTGDLGFVQDGHLYVSGRIKEMMIFNGRNLYPQDIEATIEPLSPSFRENGCAVFALEEGPVTRLVIVQEVLSRRELETEGLVERIRATLAEQHDLFDLAAVLLVKTGDIPRTSSGKIQRGRSRELFLRDGFSTLWAWRLDEAAGEEGAGTTTIAFTPPSTPTEKKLVELWMPMLEVQQLSIHDNFFDLSGHSLLATQVISALHEAFGIELSLKALFENPTIAQLAEEIDRSLREKRIAEEAAATAPVITARAASPVQQRLWYLDQFNPGDPMHVLSAGLKLVGKLDVAALQKALNEIIRRHEVLRTFFELENGQPAARVASHARLAFAPESLEEVSFFAREGALRQRLAELRVQPFKLESAPLCRADLIALDDETHHLHLAMHEIVADETSLELMLGELGALYSSYAQQRASTLPEPKLHYADYADWHQQSMQGQVLEGQIGYWRRQLDDIPVLLDLPTDHPRPAVQNHRGARHAFSIDSARTARLGALAAEKGASLDQLLATAFAVLLHRYSGQADITFGMPVANRGRSGLDTLIGALSNAVVIRSTLAPGERFDALLAQTGRILTAAEANKDAPFEAVIEALKPERHMSHSPLFQVMLDLSPEERALPVFDTLDVERTAPALVLSRYDLTMRLAPEGGTLRGSVDYCTDLFEEASIARLAGHFSTLLDALLADPDEQVARLVLLPEAERRQLVVEFNDTARDFGPPTTIPALFDAAAARRPDHTALVFEGESLSYAAFAARVNKLARYLHRQGVGPDVMVGLCIERSLEMMVALMAILKAGGAYVPLDPDYPENRLEYMIEDARPAIILTLARLEKNLPAHDLPVFRLDADWEKLADEAEDNLALIAGPRNLAYVIYTSGSTGRPKGVGVDHAGITNRLMWQSEAYGIADDERVMQKTPYSFDVSVWELFWPLISGTTLVLARPAGHQDVAYLADLVRREAITTMHFVPPMLEFFLNLADLTACRSLRKVMCSGQALPVALQQRFLALLPHVGLHNLYGPTEASVEVSFWHCRPIEGQSSVPIGHPIANIQLHVLDPELNPVPLGVAGELHLAGVGLARGYLNRPDLTADKFIPNPFSAEPGARMYKSGDLARHLPDGSVEYLGRIDDQVKIRGFRIELGEIEAQLLALDQVREAIVMARDDFNGDRRLVAYLVGDETVAADEGAAIAAIRQALLDRLPDYMVPAHFICLAQFPVNANGKVDRKALPAPDQTRGEEGYLPPRTDTEAVLAEIWAEILGLDRVSMGDNFFALGGHSLLATQAISKIRVRLQVDVPLRAILFDTPTIAELAPLVEELASTQSGSAMTTIHKVERDRDLPLSFSQQRLWFLDQLEPGNPFYNIPAPTWLRGALDVAAFHRALNEIVRRHDSLRTIFVTRHNRPIQIVLDQLELALPLVDISHLAPAAREAEARRLAAEDAQTPFKLDTAPLVRATLLKLSEREHVILFNMHHIISDGWSMGVLVKEIIAIYGAFVQGQPNPLPDLPLQYVDFANWQRLWLRGEVLQDQLRYWTRQLEGAPPVLALPTDRPRPAAQSYRGSTVELTVPKRLVSELYAIGARHQATLYMTLMTAFNILLARYARQDDLSVGTYIANRNRADIENLIGFFVNMLVIRTRIEPEASYESLLRQVRQTALDAYANQDLPFEHLVDALKPERHLSHSPLFQVVFVLQNAPMDKLELAGVSTEPLTNDSYVSKFDLTLRLTETNGQLDGCLEYATDLFDRATIERMAGHFMALLEAITRTSALPIRDLPMLAAEERRFLVETVNDTARPPAEAQDVVALIEAQARQTPAAIAVKLGDASLSYAELDARANRLAHHLAGLGIRAEDRIGIHLERSLDAIIAILAVLKTGAAYLPLDPDYPPQRLAHMLADARPRLVLAATDNTPAFAGFAVLGLDTLAEALASCPETAPDAARFPAGAAYIIYTSGSTGQPKGVVVPHASLLNHARQHIDVCALTPGDRVLQFATLNFDTAVEEIFATLAAGGTLVLRPADFLDSGTAFGAFLTAQAITVLDLPTQFWHQWVQNCRRDSLALPPALRLVIVGGEKVTRAQLAEWSHLNAGHRVRWLNTYGPTETTISVTGFVLAGALDPAMAEIPLGTPIWNVRCYVLDGGYGLSPVGVWGELHVGGMAPARGYHNRPDATAEMFLPDPFSPEPGARMYRTGDIARWRADGVLEFLGRADDQVKIRGFRVEPGEVEAALRALPALADVAVIVREDRPG